MGRWSMGMGQMAAGIASSTGTSKSQRKWTGAVSDWKHRNREKTPTPADHSSPTLRNLRPLKMWLHESKAPTAACKHGAILGNDWKLDFQAYVRSLSRARKRPRYTEGSLRQDFIKYFELSIRYTTKRQRLVNGAHRSFHQRAGFGFPLQWWPKHLHPLGSTISCVQ